jgi:hypothetical protein
MGGRSEPLTVQQIHPARQRRVGRESVGRCFWRGFPDGDLAGG